MTFDFPPRTARAVETLRSVLRIAVALPVTLILGCAHAPSAVQRADAAPAAQTQAPAAESAADRASPTDGEDARAASAEKLPDVDLNAALVYEIIAAEIAQQRGEPDAAWATLMKAARDTRDPRLARRATEIALGARALPQAVDAAQLWRDISPESVDARQTYASLLLAVGRFDDAEPLLRALLAESTAPAEELERIQRQLAHAQDHARAFALLERLAKPYADAPATAYDIHLMLANGAHAAGMAPRAVAEAEAALALRPDAERAVLVAAQFNAGTDVASDAAGRRRALELLSKFVEAHPGASDARTAYAQLLFADGRAADGRRQLDELLKLEKLRPDALFRIGALALQADLRPQARRAFERYVRIERADPESHGADPAILALARIEADDGHYPEALRWLDQLPGTEQGFAALLEKARILGRMGRIDEGRKLLDDATPANDDERTRLVLAEGQLLRDAHRYEDWSAVIERALSSSPDNVELLYDGAMAAERLDRLAPMEQHLRRVIELKPEYAHAYNALGYSFADRNIRLPEALDLINQALKLAPDDAFIIDSLGWVQFRMGRLDQARVTLERAWKMKPEADVAAHLGEVIWAQGDRDAARRIWREGRAREADNETLRQTLERLKVQLSK